MFRTLKRSYFGLCYSAALCFGLSPQLLGSLRSSGLGESVVSDLSDLLTVRIPGKRCRTSLELDCSPVPPCGPLLCRDSNELAFQTPENPKHSNHPARRFHNPGFTMRLGRPSPRPCMSDIGLPTSLDAPFGHNLLTELRWMPLRCLDSPISSCEIGYIPSRTRL